MLGSDKYVPNEIAKIIEKKPLQISKNNYKNLFVFAFYRKVP